MRRKNAAVRVAYPAILGALAVIFVYLASLARGSGELWRWRVCCPQRR